LESHPYYPYTGRLQSYQGACVTKVGFVD
jgi:hypothetical protein